MKFLIFVILVVALSLLAHASEFSSRRKPLHVNNSIEEVYFGTLNTLYWNYLHDWTQAQNLIVCFKVQKGYHETFEPLPATLSLTDNQSLETLELDLVFNKIQNRKDFKWCANVSPCDIWADLQHLRNRLHEENTDVRVRFFQPDNGINLSSVTLEFSGGYVEPANVVKEIFILSSRMMTITAKIDACGKKECSFNVIRHESHQTNTTKMYLNHHQNGVDQSVICSSTKTPESVGVMLLLERQFSGGGMMQISEPVKVLVE